MYKADGTKLRSRSMPVTEDPVCVRAFRDELALWCIKEAQRQYPQAIDFHFNSPIQSVDFDRQIAHVHTAESHATKVCSTAFIVHISMPEKVANEARFGQTTVCDCTSMCSIMLCIGESRSWDQCAALP